MFYCPHCGKHNSYLFPLEPMYDMKVIATIIPMNPNSIGQLLNRHFRHWPKYYRKFGSAKNTRRLLPASQVRALREYVLSRGKGNDVYTSVDAADNKLKEFEHAEEENRQVQITAYEVTGQEKIQKKKRKGSPCR